MNIRDNYVPVDLEGIPCLSYDESKRKCRGYGNHKGYGIECPYSCLFREGEDTIKGREWVSNCTRRNLLLKLIKEAQEEQATT